MSYKVEHFRGHWFDEGLVFATQGEAKAYSQHKGIIPSRVVEATHESSMQSGVPANDVVNYTFKDGRLEHYKEPSKVSISWEEYMLAGGHGMPWFVPEAVMVRLPEIPSIPGYETKWVARQTLHWPMCADCGSRLKGVHAYRCGYRKPMDYDTHNIPR